MKDDRKEKCRSISSIYYIINLLYIFVNILTIYIFNLLSHNTGIFLFDEFDKKLIKQAISRVDQEIYNN